MREHGWGRHGIVSPVRHARRGREAAGLRVGPDRGAAAAEFAMVMPALVMVILVILAAAAVGLGQLRAYEAARAGAREAARGEATSEVEKAAKQKAGAGSSVGVKKKGAYTVVEVVVPLPDSIKFVKHTAKARAEARTETSTATGATS